MPTERFFRLREEKRKIISESVTSECKQSLYGELHLSKIARNAHISRGSLYTYFYNKEDMLEFALNQMWESVLEAGKRQLLKSDGDYWSMLLGTLKYYLHLCSHQQFCRLLYLEQEKTMLRCGSLFKQKSEEWAHRSWVYQHLDRKQINCTEEEFKKLYDDGWLLLLGAVRQYLFNVRTDEQILEEFNNKLSQLKIKYAV